MTAHQAVHRIATMCRVAGRLPQRVLGVAEAAAGATRRAAEAAAPSNEKTAAEAAQQRKIEERQRREVWSRPDAWSRWG